MQETSHSVRLTIDLGNSFIKAGLFTGDKILDRQGSPSVEEIVGCISAWNASTVLCGIGICSVVPDRSAFLISRIREFSDVQIFEVNHLAKHPIHIHYLPAESLGHDRLAAACAVWHPGQPHIIVDAGTAVTVDLISTEGVFLGGCIMPGPAIANRALSEYTVNLPNVPLTPPAGGLGNSTVSALQHGLVYGLADGIIGAITRMKNSLDQAPSVTLTGGWSHLFANHIPEAHIRENLVLHGIRVLMQFNGM